ncbi:MAG: corrinoid ABC transporter substrate-binding protein [Methanosaeta sp. PtaU1.Bin112]|nr:MAG: corrinoid ABC transporter substrate-binding protein [Methanosaeta sp. PtaU1.Bin112]
MIKKRKLHLALFLLLVMGALIIAPISAEEYKTVTDMRGVAVSIPEDPQRVVAMNGGLIDEVMYIFGVQDKMVGCCNSQNMAYSNYTYGDETYHVCTTIRYVLYPEYYNLTNVGYFGTGPFGLPNVETIASLEPDLLILRYKGDDDEKTSKFLESMKGLDIPVVVLKYPDCYDEVKVDTIYEEISLLGEVFSQQEKAEKTIDLMKKQVQLIRDRTRNISEEDKPRVLFFGSTALGAKKSGGTGNAFGTKSIQSIFLDDIINAKNAYNSTVTQVISAEELLSIDPDIILLSTWGGYHPPREMYEDEWFKNIQALRALQERQVYSLPANGFMEERLEFPISLIVQAKAVYPDQFEDIDLEEWTQDYFKELYGVDDEKANELLNSLLLRYLEII